MNALSSKLFSSVIGTNITFSSYLICALAAIASGVILALVLGVFGSGKKYSYSFLSTVVLLPFVVGTVIMLVNGNVGTGVAVAGAFSLVRFRSAPGSARDIAVIFLSMASGLSAGTGYVGVCAVLTVVGAIILVLLALIGRRVEGEDREIRITIPENIDYEGVFDDIFAEYTGSHYLVSVKTTNMGSMFKLKYRVKFKSGVSQKEFIDRLRERNGNLEINVSTVIDDDSL